MKLKIHHFKLKWEPIVINLHRDIPFFVDIVQCKFKIFDLSFHRFLVVLKQFQGKLINNDSHLADVPHSAVPGPLTISSAMINHWSRHHFVRETQTWEIILAVREGSGSLIPIKPFS